MPIGRIIGGSLLAKVLKYSPQVIDAAQQLYEAYAKERQRVPGGTGDLHGRLEALESAGMEQAELMGKLAQQVRDLSVAVERLSARVTLLSRVLFSAASVAIVLLLLRLFR